MKVKRILGLALAGTVLLCACAGGPDKNDKTDGNVMIAYDNLKNASIMTGRVMPMYLIYRGRRHSSMTIRCMSSDFRIWRVSSCGR